MSPVTCAFCLVNTTSQPFRAAGLDICESCFSQQADATEAWGLKIEPNYYSKLVRNGDTSTLYQFAEVRVHHPTRCPFVATFTNDYPPPALLAWFGLGGSGDPEIGDPLFDDHVLVQTEQPDVVEMLKPNEGLQSGIMSALGIGSSGRVVFEGNAVFARIADGGEGAFLDQGEINALVVAIAIQVERYARGI